MKPRYAQLQLVDIPVELQLLLDSEYAYLALLLVFLLEGAMLLFFIPSEIIVPGAVAALGSSSEDVFLIIGVAVIGATVGQYALFVLAKRVGRRYLLERRWFRVSDERLARYEGWFDRWGPIVIPVSNSLMFTRGMVTVPAGFADLDDRRFLALSATGTLVFETILAVLYFAGVSVVW